MTQPGGSLKDRIKDGLERAGSAAAEQFLAVVAIVPSARLAGLPWAFALSTAGGAFVVSALLTLVQYAARAGALPFWADVALRVAKSFASSLLATFGGGQVDLLHVAWSQTLNVAAIAALLAGVKCLLSPNAHLSGSVLPTPVVARLHGVAVRDGGYVRE